MRCSVCGSFSSKSLLFASHLLKKRTLNGICAIRNPLRLYSDRTPTEGPPGGTVCPPNEMGKNGADDGTFAADQKMLRNLEIERTEREFTELKTAFGLSNISSSLREQRILLVHPRVRKMAVKNSTIQQQIDEAQTLCETIPGFNVVSAIVLNTDAKLIRKKFVWGMGRLEKIREWMHKHPVNALCVNIDILSPVQQCELNAFFGVPIYDRYTIVLNIFKIYAQTEEARLQIALAEIPYIRQRLNFIESNKSSAYSEELADSVNFDEMMPSLGRTTQGTRRVEILRMREHSLRKQIRNAIEKRASAVRQRLDTFASANASKMAVIGIIGYTNAGKTSLIKALTDEQSLCGENRLFATLDTTLHQAVLPSRHKILLADTIGFISKLPINLFASFSATLQHIENADLLIHVLDLANADILAQRDQVIQTLKGLAIRSELIDRIITVGNKLDKCTPEKLSWLRRRALLPPEKNTTSDEPSTPSSPSLFPLPVSCRTMDGMADLIRLMDQSIRSIIGSRVRRFRLAPGSVAIPYLYSEGFVPAGGPATSECGQFLIFDISMTDAQFERFKSVMGTKVKLKKTNGASADC